MWESSKEWSHSSDPGANRSIKKSHCLYYFSDDKTSPEVKIQDSSRLDTSRQTLYNSIVYNNESRLQSQTTNQTSVEEQLMDSSSSGFSGLQAMDTDRNSEVFLHTSISDMLLYILYGAVSHGPAKDSSEQRVTRFTSSCEHLQMDETPRSLLTSSSPEVVLRSIMRKDSSRLDTSSQTLFNNIVYNNESRLPSQTTNQSSEEEQLMDSSSSGSSGLLSVYNDSGSEVVLDTFISDLLLNILQESDPQVATKDSNDQSVTGVTNTPEHNTVMEPKVRSSIPGGGDIMATNSESSSYEQSQMDETPQSLNTTSSPEVVLRSIMRKTLGAEPKETTGSALLPPNIYAKVTGSSSLPDLLVQSAEPDSRISRGDQAFPVTRRAPSSDRHHQFQDFLHKKKLLNSLQKVEKKSVCKSVPDNREKVLFDSSMSSRPLKLVSPVYSLHAIRDGRPSGDAPDQDPSPPSQPRDSKIQFEVDKKTSAQTPGMGGISKQKSSLTSLIRPKMKDIQPGLPSMNMRKESLPPITGLTPLTEQKSKLSLHDQTQNKLVSDYPYQVPRPPKSVSLNSPLIPMAKSSLHDRSQAKPANGYPHREPHPPMPKIKQPSLENASYKPPIQLTSLIRPKMKDIQPGFPSTNMRKESLPPITGLTPLTEKKSKLSLHDQTQNKLISDYPYQVPRPPKSVSLNSPLTPMAKSSLHDRSQAKPANGYPHREPHPPMPKIKQPSLENASYKPPIQASMNPSSRGLASKLTKPYTCEEEAVSSRLSRPKKLDPLPSSPSTIKPNRASQENTKEVLKECLIESAVSLMRQQYKTEKELASNLGFTIKSFDGIYSRRMAKLKAENAKFQLPITRESPTRYGDGCVAPHRHWDSAKGESVHQQPNTSKNSPIKVEQGNLFPSVAATPKMAAHCTNVRHPLASGGKKTSVAATPKMAAHCTNVRHPLASGGKKTLCPKLPKIV